MELLCLCMAKNYNVLDDLLKKGNKYFVLYLGLLIQGL